MGLFRMCDLFKYKLDFSERVPLEPSRAALLLLPPPTSFSGTNKF
jgi:hypothetical protein